MTTTVVAAARVATGHQVLAPGAVTIEGATIAAVSRHVADGVAVRPGWLVPGFVDIHAHGGGGASVSGARADDVATVAATHRRHGTTTIVASLVSEDADALRRDVVCLADLVADGLVAGTHLEGPWISPARPGAHDPAVIRPPDPRELDHVLAAGRGTIVMVTLAPEVAGGLDAIRQVSDAGAIAAVGHTEADWTTTRRAIDAGATVATHLFNQMPPIGHRDPGPVPALLADPRMHVELIADGVHVHPGVIALVHQAVAPQRIVLVTDAMAAAGGPGSGDYSLGGRHVRVESGRARLAGSTVLAGSTLTMDEAFRRAVTEGGFSVHDAVLASAATPARLLGRDDRGVLEVGRRADLLWLDDELTLRAVWQQGRPVGLEA